MATSRYRIQKNIRFSRGKKSLIYGLVSPFLKCEFWKIRLGVYPWLRLSMTKIESEKRLWSVDRGFTQTHGGFCAVKCSASRIILIVIEFWSVVTRDLFAPK